MRRLLLMLSLGVSLGGPTVSFFTAGLRAEDASAGLPPAVDRKVSYEADVKPLLERSCYRCHQGGKHKGDLRLDRKSAALRGGESGKVLLAGKSAESLLIHLVAGTDPKKVMPPGRNKRLTAAEVGVLRAWVDQGIEWPEKFAGEDAAGFAQEPAGPGVASSSQGGIAWFGTLKSALTEAHRTGKPILLVSAAPHCHNISGIW